MGRAAVTLKHNKCHMITFCKCQVIYLCGYSAVPCVPKSQELQCENAVVREGVSCILLLISPKRRRRKPRLANVVLFQLALTNTYQGRLRKKCGEILPPLLTEAQDLVTCSFFGDFIEVIETSTLL